MAFLGTVDPEGWVICDGGKNIDGTSKPARSNTDGRYNNLIANSIGTGVANSGNYTPPDYRGAFLRGAGTNPSDTRNKGPSNLNTSQVDLTAKHTHHTSITFITVSNPLTSGSGPTYYASSNNGVSLGSGDPIVSENRTGDETRPYNYGVNWIIKL